MSRYVIITPAHNEEEFLERTIESVVKQTIPPRKWVIVDDGSKDRTTEIALGYQRNCKFIQLIRCEREPGRHFGNKVMAFKRGLVEMMDVGYEYIGNLDADVSLEKDYYEMILQEFDNDSQLGIAGGMVYYCSKGKFFSHDVSLDSVGGQIQLFRRSCYEASGIHTAPYGGIDAAAEIMARMKGWKVRTFSQYRVFEQRETGWAQVVSWQRKEARAQDVLIGIQFLVLRPSMHFSLQGPSKDIGKRRCSIRVSEWHDQRRTLCFASGSCPVSENGATKEGTKVCWIPESDER